jgi:sensor domain CHASE-containing protein
MNSSMVRVDDDPVTIAVAQILQNRAVIEQAKGVLMAVYDIDADAAFDLLKLRSQHANVKVRVLAEQLMTDARSVQPSQQLPTSSPSDEYFLAANERDNDV